jgi:hypothetical protein
MPVRSPEERFWSHVQKTDTCWLWTRATRSGAYGVLRVGSRSVSTHRFAWELAHGPVPTVSGATDGTSRPWRVQHTCGNRRCVRPEHLRLVPPESGVVQPAALRKSIAPEASRPAGGEGPE